MSDTTLDETVASKVPFGQLCQLFERIRRGKSNAVRRQELQKFICRWRELHDQLHKNTGAPSESSDSFFPALRLLLPQLDRERPSYGVKETLLAKLYITVLGLSKTNPDAKKLLEYKNPKTNRLSTGDFAEIAYVHVLSKRCNTHGSLTIQQVNELLDKIALFNTESKKDKVQKTLLRIIQKTSASEQKWLIRILLKDTRIKLGHSIVLEEFHPDAEEIYNVTTSLRQVCTRLKDRSVRLADTEIELNLPFRPMLALNAKLNEVEKLMDQKQFIIEIKYDGERSQMHKNRMEYKYFSRNGWEYSTVFGNNPYSGSLTPHIHDLFAEHVETCILDGEMMGYDPKMKLFMQKGGKFDIKHVTEDSDLQPCFVAFDLLFLNGENLTSKPLSERILKLKSALKPDEGRIQFSECKQATSNQEVLEYLNEAIDRREEGIIIKHPKSPYAPNKRKGSGWFKIKPEYVGGVVDDMDLVIVGGKFGSGRHGSLINKFMLAVREGDGGNSKYKSLSMVGSGYTDKELLEITETLKPHLKLFEKKKPPSWLFLGKEKPEVVVHPDNSVVVQVRATEITESTAYATGCTLRFPRIVATRDDKKPADAMNFEQLEQLKNMADGKLASRHATLSSEPSLKRRKVRAAPQPTIAANFRAADVSGVEKISSSFDGQEFCVMTGTPDNSKVSLETRIAAHGGSIVQNSTKDTFCVFARDEKNIRVRNVIKVGKHDVVKVSWLVETLEQGTIRPFKPSDMIFASTATEQKFSVQFDKYGDEYSVDVDEEKLRDMFAKIPNEEVEACFPFPQEYGNLEASQKFVNDVYSRYARQGFHDIVTSLFQGFHFYVDDKLIINDPSTRKETSSSRELRAVILFYNGILDDIITESTTHVIFLKKAVGDCRQRDIKALRKTQERNFHLVNEEWVYSSVENNSLEHERMFTV